MLCEKERSDIMNKINIIFVVVILTIMSFLTACNNNENSGEQNIGIQENTKEDNIDFLNLNKLKLSLYKNEFNRLLKNEIDEFSIGNIKLENEIHKIKFITKESENVKDRKEIVMQAVSNEKVNDLVHFEEDMAIDLVELSVWNDKYLVIAGMFGMTEDMSALLIFDATLDNMVKANNYYDVSAQNFKYEIKNDEIIGSFYEFTEPLEISENGMSILYRVDYKIIESNGKLEIVRLLEDKTDIKYSAMS